MTTERIDVLAVMDSAIQSTHNRAQLATNRDLREARAAVAELIERGKALQRKAGAHEWKAFAEALARVHGGAL